MCDQRICHDFCQSTKGINCLFESLSLSLLKCFALIHNNATIARDGFNVMNSCHEQKQKYLLVLGSVLVTSHLTV